MLLRYAFIIFPRALFEEYLPEHLLLLLVRVIILDVVVAGRVEHRIVVMIAVRVSISHLLVY